MHGFKSIIVPISPTNSDMYCQPNSPFYLRGDEGGRNGPRFADLGELELSPGTRNDFHHDNAVHLSRSSIYNNDMKASTVSHDSNNLQFGGLNNSLGSVEMGSSGGVVESGPFMLHKGGMVGINLGNIHFENWCDSSVVADHSQQTDTSTDTDDRNQFPGVQHERLIAVDSTDQSKSKEKVGDQKVVRRLAQNREAARKSRMRKKVHVQQLENSQLKLSQLEQELKKIRQQGISVASGFLGNQNNNIGGNGALAFDIDYVRWLQEHQRLINNLRSAVNSYAGDCELRLHVHGVMSHYDELFRLKNIGAKLDVFHILSGMWKTPAERCFMWLGGFRCSEVLKIIENQIEPLTDQQLVSICSLQQSSQQAEDALTQGMEALQQSLVETLSADSFSRHSSGNVANYMGQMAIAMSKLTTLENFLHQADLLRQQTLQQLQRILTILQLARALLAINNYNSKLRALSSLWLARPKEQSF